MTYFSYVDLNVDLDLGSNFEFDLNRSKAVYFEPPRREKHDGDQIIAVSYLSKKLLAKTNFVENQFFSSYSVTSGALTIDLEVKSV